MMRIWLTSGLFGGLLLGCSTMQDMPLYDLDLSPTAEERVSKYAHRDIYLDDANSLMFGRKAHPCKRVDVVRNGSVEGADHLRVKWSQTDSCRYLGVGFPWANHLGKNLKPLEKIAAIQCHIKLEQGTASKLPMFFALIDYAGRQATSKINLLDVEGQTFDNQWRKAHIPLSAFRAAARGVNLENIKELRIEFQREGCVHLDGLRIVPFDHEGEKLSSRSEDVCGALPLDLDRSKLWWGIQEEAPSSSVFWSESPGNSFLVLKHVKSGINGGWNAFGVALNGWEMLDMTEVHSHSALTFRLEGTWAPLGFSIWSGKGKPRHIQSTLTPQHCVLEEEGVWSCALPIKSMPRHDEFHWACAREVRVTMPDDTDICLHDFTWETYRGHPDKVQRWLQRREP